MVRPFLAILASASLTIATTNSASAADLESYFPKDTDLVVSINVRQVLDSAVIKTHAADLIRATLSTSKVVQESIKALGLDPLADFSRVTIGVSLDNINNPRVIVIVEGKFDPDKVGKLMEELVKKDSKQFGIEKTGGKLVYRILPANQQMPVYAAVLNAGIIVLGTVKESVVNAFDAATGTRKSEIRKELSNLLAKADPKVSLTFAGHVKGRLGAIPLPDADLKKMIEQVESITGEVRLDQDLQTTITLSTSSAEIAKQVQSLAESAISLYRLQLKLALSDQPELKPLVDFATTVKAVQQEKNIVLTANLNGVALGKLLKPEKK